MNETTISAEWLATANAYSFARVCTKVKFMLKCQFMEWEGSMREGGFKKEINPFVKEIIDALESLIAAIGRHELETPDICKSIDLLNKYIDALGNNKSVLLDAVVRTSLGLIEKLDCNIERYPEINAVMESLGKPPIKSKHEKISRNSPQETP